MSAGTVCEFFTDTTRWLMPYSRAQETPPREMSLVHRPHGAVKRQTHGWEGQEQIQRREGLVGHSLERGLNLDRLTHSKIGARSKRAKAEKRDRMLDVWELLGRRVSGKVVPVTGRSATEQSVTTVQVLQRVWPREGLVHK